MPFCKERMKKVVDYQIALMNSLIMGAWRESSEGQTGERCIGGL